MSYLNGSIDFIGRKNEIYDLERILSSEKAELVSLIGKRRIGKTSLAKEMMRLTTSKRENVFSFYFTGQYEMDKKNSKRYLNDALLSYVENSNELFTLLEKGILNEKPKDFYDFFNNLKKIYLQIKKKYGENFLFLVFFDEVPWIEGKNITKNGFKNNFSLFWNDVFCSDKMCKFFISGSATHWIIENFLNDKGGFHGRITDTINLKPFSLQENYEFLIKNINPEITKKESILYYMAFGGVGYYLSLCRKGLSFKENVKLLFHENVLINEYDNLFRSIFDKKVHKDIITVLAEKKSVGLTIKQMCSNSFLSKYSENDIRLAVEDLRLSNFIKERKYFDHFGKEKVFYLNDIFSYFHISFLEKNKGNKTFSVEDHKFKIWADFAFELVMLNQVDVIKKACGFLDVETEEYCWRNEKAQVDLVIERKDKKIHLVETKFRDCYVYDENEAKDLNEKYKFFQKEIGVTPEIILVILDEIVFSKQNDLLINPKRKIVKISEEI